MTGEMLPSQATPNEPGPDWIYSDVELDVIDFSRSMADAHNNRQDAEAQIRSVEERLKHWQESGRHFPFRAWARDVMDPTEVDESGKMIPHRYTDGTVHERIGGWIPADRYKIVRIHYDVKEGLMAWVQSQSDTVDRRYNILPADIQLVDDATILKERGD